MKKVAITQDLCRMVELMLKGGAQQKEVGERLGISKATVSRIKTAGYDLGQYRKNTTERVEKENQAEETVCIPLKPGQVIEVYQKPEEITAFVSQAEEQVPGQISMDLEPKAEEPAPEMRDQTKLIRFLAKAFTVLETNMDASTERISAKLDRINDSLCQILRKMDG